jgi:integrase
MPRDLNDYELADAISRKFPNGKTPIYGVVIDENSGTPIGVDFESGPYCVLDETDEDYGLKADALINASIPENTQRAYRGDIQYITQWLINGGFVTEINPKGTWPVTEEIVLKFILHHLDEMPGDLENILISKGWKRSRGTHSLATVKRRLVSLSILHKMSNQADPCDTQKVKALLAAIGRKNSQQKKSKAITKNILENLLATCSKETLIDIRDKALLLFGWASGGRRRSEISQATIENLEENADGDYIYHIEKSKTDQLGKGHDVPIKGVAAMALRNWLRSANITSGNIFRSVGKSGKVGEKITDVDINRIVKKRAEMAGYDPKQYSAHGLRRGFITEGGKQGCPIGDLMALSGHKSVPIAMGYYESGAVINNKAANLMS